MKRFAIFGVSGCGRGEIPLAKQQLEKPNTSDWDLFFLDHGVHAEANN